MEKESEVKKEITTTELTANAVMAKAPFPQFFFRPRHIALCHNIAQVALGLLPSEKKLLPSVEELEKLL